MAEVGAIILGGGRITDPAFREATGVDCKSLIPISGKPMALWVIDALHGAQGVGDIVLVGPPELAGVEGANASWRFVTEGSHEVDNLLVAMEAAPHVQRILMVASDMPLLTREAVDDLIESAPDADVVYPAVPKPDTLERFPDRKWVFVKTKEGRFTGSSAVLFRPEVFRRHEDRLRRVFDSRRSVAGLVKMWGLGFAARFALGRLSIKDAEARISEVLGIDGRAYISRYPELAFDVDKPSDIGVAERALSAH